METSYPFEKEVRVENVLGQGKEGQAIKVAKARSALRLEIGCAAILSRDFRSQRTNGADAFSQGILAAASLQGHCKWEEIKRESSRRGNTASIGF